MFLVYWSPIAWSWIYGVNPNEYFKTGTPVKSANLANDLQ